MADIIKLLPDSLANQIAAGEVIQRPASLVKELLENSIDAGSTRIQLVVRDAGKALIQVSDNGSGMSEIDARMCFERHATSKIKQVDDLFNLATMGFRGEALASIAAVAQVEMKTRTAEEEVGTHIYIEGSVLKFQQPGQCAKGTMLAVKNLFFNVPARRNFLKSNQIEMRHIIEEFQRVAMPNPKIEFSLVHNDTEMYRLPAANLRKRIVNLIGQHLNDRLMPVEENTDFVRIYGFIGKPEFGRKNRNEQYFFVNERFIRSGYLHNAVMNAYADLLPKDTFPVYFLFIDIQPSRIDVNVHPTKQEIKFEDEKLVYTYMQAAVKRAIGNYTLTPMLDFEQDMPLDLIATGRKQPPTTTSTVTPPMAKNTSAMPDSGQWQRPKIPTNWEELYRLQPLEELLPSSETTAMSSLSNELSEIENPTETITVESRINEQVELGLSGVEGVTATAAPPLQIHQTYILSHIQSGFILIHQQLASERILYEKNMRNLANQSISSQKLLFPQTLQLSRADADLLQQIIPELNALGYDISFFGQDTFIAHGIPTWGNPTGLSEQQVIEQLLEHYKTNAQQMKTEKAQQVARALAQQYAVKVGQKLTTTEMEALIDQLFACELPYLSPTGKPTFVTYRLEDIAKQFDAK